MVIPFGQTNAPASFREIIDTIFIYMEVCIWFLNDFLNYGSTIQAEQEAIVKHVPQQCVEHRLAVYLLKSNFHLRDNIFLVQVINSQLLNMDPSNSKAC